MPTPIRIAAAGVTVAATLNDSPTAARIAAALPIRGQVNRWGDEIYFAIDVKDSQAADARTEMQVGELAYWPAGSAFCIFWGKTPASQADEPRAYSEVNPVGMIDGHATVLAGVGDGEPITMERASS